MSRYTSHSGQPLHQKAVSAGVEVHRILGPIREAILLCLWQGMALPNGIDLWAQAKGPSLPDVQDVSGCTV